MAFRMLPRNRFPYPRSELATPRSPSRPPSRLTPRRIAVRNLPVPAHRASYTRSVSFRAVHAADGIAAGKPYNAEAVCAGDAHRMPPVNALLRRREPFYGAISFSMSKPRIGSFAGDTGLMVVFCCASRYAERRVTYGATRTVRPLSRGFFEDISSLVL